MCGSTVIRSRHIILRSRGVDPDGVVELRLVELLVVDGVESVASSWSTRGAPLGTAGSTTSGPFVDEVGGKLPAAVPRRIGLGPGPRSACRAGR